MSWFGLFSLGAASGVVASLALGVATVFVHENGIEPVVAVFEAEEPDDFDGAGVAASKQVFGQLAWGVFGKELNPPPISVNEEFLARLETDGAVAALRHSMAAFTNSDVAKLGRYLDENFGTEQLEALGLMQGGMNQMGGMQGGMNQMQGGMGMGGMNQMGMQGNNMNMMGNQMNNHMGMQGNNMMGNQQQQWR